MYQSIIFQNTDGVARITLNRPQVHHALNPEILTELLDAFGAAGADDSVRVIVLSASGDKAFCSGADLKAATGTGKSVGELLTAYYNPLILAIRNIAKPVVCKLNGLAAGAGASLALACDVIIASENAYLCQIFVRIGLMPDAGATFFLPRLIGMAKAFELASTGRNVYAPEAAQIGMINRSVPENELDSAIEETVAYYRNAPTKAIGTMKALLNQSYQSELHEILELEALNQNALSKTEDAAEGIMSFIQKRKPDYQGK
jgi:2-(1,2-epoxy-1,2-dihydrophenyl)acetyl-CoA isomerase